MKRNFIHSAFLTYLDEQQGKSYVEDQKYNIMSFEDIKNFEDDHYKDFCVEFVENTLKGEF